MATVATKIPVLKRPARSLKCMDCASFMLLCIPNAYLSAGFIIGTQ